MKPEKRSSLLLGVTRSKAKMFEYAVPQEDHIEIKQDPARLFPLTIGILGEISVQINSDAAPEPSAVELKRHLQFAANFFDSYILSQLDNKVDHYLLILASSAYYLCDMPGSAQVLCDRLGEAWDNVGGDGLESLLHWLLKGDTNKIFTGTSGQYGRFIDFISSKMAEYYHVGTGFDEVESVAFRLRKFAYENGSPRQLLLADVIGAVLKKKYKNSSWYCLPQYTGIQPEDWRHALLKPGFPRDFWPSQHLLGKKGIYLGVSAVVQMPTSAGKTKATEIIIRSSFLSGRSEMAVVVAPFRALCHEIKNDLAKSFHGESIIVDEVSDVIQVDYDLQDLIVLHKVLVLTPEKLLYILRNSPQLGPKIGLLIYDEAHQFDSGTRGITYELLLTSLHSLVPTKAQKILISAVISNAQAVGEWVNGKGSEVVSGANLSPTQRTVAFASWLDQRGRLEFVDQQNPDQREFFVPRVIDRFPLTQQKRVQAAFFPDKNDGQGIALYLVSIRKHNVLNLLSNSRESA